MPLCIYPEVNRIHHFDIKYSIYMTITLYMTCNTFICTILFGLLKSPKITQFKDLIDKKIKAKVAEMFIFAFFHNYL